MRQPTIRAHVDHACFDTDDEVIADNFAGGGGASEGIFLATGRHPDVAINHDPEAIAMHKANHPSTNHVCGNVWDVRPRELFRGRRVGLAWFSPDCTYHSKAKGGAPRKKAKAEKSRALAWVVTRWANDVRPRVIVLENVEEFADWGPLNLDGRPDKRRKGLTYRRWIKQLENAGYEVQARELRAHDYGAPTTRKRLFVIARCDGRPIVWPEPTHGPGRARPHRTAAECISWELPCPSIFNRSRPLAANTLRRIARGIDRYVIQAARPFLVPNTHQGDLRVYSVDDPLRTITCAHRGEISLVSPSFILPATHGANAAGPDSRVHSVEEPLRTIITRGAPFHLVAPTLIQTGYGERPPGPKSPLGQAPRALDIEKPLGTIVGGQKHALVAAYLAKHNGGHEATGSALSAPLHTVTTKDHHALVTAAFVKRDFGQSVGGSLEAPAPTVTAGGGGHSSLVTSHMLKLRGTCLDGQPIDAPAPTITAGGTHLAEVRAFLTKYYGTAVGQSLDAALGTLTTRERFGLVMVDGEPHAIADIGMRMLQPRELFRAQGFSERYIIDPVVKNKHGKMQTLTKTAQIRCCGNSVCPDLAAALVGANWSRLVKAATA